MNILMVGDSFYPDTFGGSHRVIYELAKRYAAQGDNVYVLTPLREGKAEEEIVDGIHVVRYPRRKGLLGFLDFLKAPAKACKELEKFIHFDVINGHWPLTSYKVFKRHPKTKKVFFFHGPSFLEYKTEMENKNAILRKLFVAFIKHYEAKAIKLADETVVASNYMKGLLLENFKPKNEPHRVPLACDSDKFELPSSKQEARRKINIPQDEFAILTLRRLKKRMGLDLLIRAMPQVIEKIPNTTLYIGGKGDYLPNLEALAEECGVRDRIRFLGFVPDKDIATYYGSADLSVVPSLTLEGFGLVSLEAMCSGTPVVATAAGGNIDVVGGLDERLLSKPNDPEALADCIISFYGRKEEYPPEKVRSYAVTTYSWEKTAASIKELFK